MSLVCSFAEHMCRCAGDKKSWMCSNSLSPLKSVMVNPLSCYLALACFIPGIISDFSLMLHDCTNLKSASLIFCVVKSFHIQRKSISISILYWYFSIVGGKNTLGVFFWLYVLLLLYLSCMMGI